MVRTVFLLNEFLVNVRINLRRADVRMSEEFLQHAQVHARLQAMRGKAVPERMRRAPDIHGETVGTKI